MFTVSFDTSNAAFDRTYNGDAIAEVLHKIAASLRGINLENGGTESVRDLNGNTIGQITYERDYSPDTLYVTERNGVTAWTAWSDLTEYEQDEQRELDNSR